MRDFFLGLDITIDIIFNLLVKPLVVIALFEGVYLLALWAQIAEETLRSSICY